MSSKNGIGATLDGSSPARASFDIRVAAWKYVMPLFGSRRLVGSATSARSSECRDSLPTYAPSTKKPCPNSRPMLKSRLIVYGARRFWSIVFAVASTLGYVCGKPEGGGVGSSDDGRL